MPTSLIMPLLAGTLPTLAHAKFPCYASPKVDGFRMMVQGGNALSRSLKPIRNEHTRKLYSQSVLSGLDGELVAGDELDPAVFNLTSSLVTTRIGEPATTFFVFDVLDLHKGYEVRKSILQARVTLLQNKYKSLPIKLLPQVPVYSYSQLVKLYEKWFAAGYEGIMLRSFGGLYKQGKTAASCRSTLIEGILLKFKEFEDAEAVIVGTYEQMENTNSKVLQPNGSSKRTSHKAGKLGKGTLGGFEVLPVVPNGLCLPDLSKSTFNIATGPGLTDALRAELWAKRATLSGKVIKYKYQAVGTKDSPRIPLWVGFRSKEDM